MKRGVFSALSLAWSVVAASACNGHTTADSSAGSAADQGAAVPCPVTPAAEGGPALPNYVPPDALPNGESCTSTSACMVNVAVPCANPAELPPVATWQCTCASSTWSCQLEYSSHSICTGDDAGLSAD